MGAAGAKDRDARAERLDVPRWNVMKNYSIWCFLQSGAFYVLKSQSPAAAFGIMGTGWAEEVGPASLINLFNDLISDCNPPPPPRKHLSFIVYVHRTLHLWTRTQTAPVSQVEPHSEC